MKVNELMKKIIYLEIKPDIFKVVLIATDHSIGFTAYVDFRSNYSNPHLLSQISAHGFSPETALQSLYDALIDKFGPCTHCGRTGPVEKKNE